MSRNKLYESRIEICLTPDQKKILEKLAKKYNKTMNEIVRQAICEMWETV